MVQNWKAKKRWSIAFWLPSSSHPVTLPRGNQSCQSLLYRPRGILHMFRQSHDFLVFLTILTQTVRTLPYLGSLNLILHLRDYSIFIIKIFVLIFYNCIQFYCREVQYLFHRISKTKLFCTTACKPKKIFVRGKKMSPFSAFYLNHLQFLYQKIKLKIFILHKQ